MKTYKITGSTNGYIASRDIHFNGRTTYDLATGLSKEEAIKKLESFFNEDCPNAIIYNTEDEFIFDKYYVKIEEQAEAVGETMKEYYEATAKRWKLYHRLKANKFDVFTTPGYYSSDSCGCLLAKDGEQYEYDGRYYGINEE